MTGFDRIDDNKPNRADRTKHYPSEQQQEQGACNSFAIQTGVNYSGGLDLDLRKHG